MIRWALAVWLIATPAFSEFLGWPALYDVANVAEDDVLNIRADPSAAAELIGTLAPNATDVEVMVTNEDGAWGMVNIHERRGWVSFAFLARKPGQFDGDFPEFTNCSGTEPFWSLNRQGEEVSFEPFDGNSSEVASIQWTTTTINHRQRHSFRAGEMIGVLSRVHCNDGMSDLEFGLELNLIRLTGERRHYQGCCSIAPHGE